VDALRDDEPPGEVASPEHTYLGMIRRDMQVMIGALGGNGSLFDNFATGDTSQP
jgi:hypothetical protein